MNKPDLIPKSDVTLYKQAGVIGRFQGTLVAQWCAGMKEYFDHTYEDIWMFIKPGEEAEWYFQEDRMHPIAKEFLEKSKDGFPAGWQERFDAMGKDLHDEGKVISKVDLTALSFRELQTLYEHALQRHQAMWALGIFIDSLDAGEDQAGIEKIVAEHLFSAEEAQLLVSPHAPSYSNLWDQALYDVKIGKRTAREVAEEFFWIRTDYHYFSEIDSTFVAKEAENAEFVEWHSPEPEEKEVLQRHALSTNPLATFQALTKWRDDRKRNNFVGLYAIMRILTEIARRRGIDAVHVRNLLPREAKELFVSEPSDELRETLKGRFDTHTFIHTSPNGEYVAVDGAAARDAFAQLLAHEKHMEVTDLKGMIACRGFVKGTARIVPGPETEAAKRFQKGDILITSMTRPEFVPLMRLASGIVTDEGGITSHAAIVSREMGKPCIIGTKYATSVFKDGDMVEVDAVKGIVRKL